MMTLRAGTIGSVASWSSSAVAAVDALRGARAGAIVTDEFGGTSQTSVLTDRGAAVLASWVPLAAIPDGARLIVRLTAPRIARDLGLPLIRVRWFGPPAWDTEVLVHDVDAAHPTFAEPIVDDHQRLLAGITSPTMPYTILIHVGLRGDHLLRTLAHEMRHAQQLWGSLEVPHEAREQDAVAFAEWWMEQPR